VDSTTSVNFSAYLTAGSKISGVFPAPQLLVLARHAESARNHTKPNQVFFTDSEERERYAGLSDHLTPLTDHGWTQARELGVRLRSKFGSFDYALDVSRILWKREMA
jgi:broad specificity phosphatase PhoE